MAVQTVGFEFTAKDTGMQEAFVRLKKGMNDLQLAADNIKVSKIGDDAKVSLDVTGKSIKAITADLQALKLMFIDTSVVGEKISAKPFAQLKTSIQDVIKSLKEANNLATTFGKANLLSSSPKATVRATGNAEIKAIQNQLNAEVAKAQKDFEESSIKDKKAYDAQIKALYTQSAADILVIVRRTQAELSNLTSREGVVKLGQTNSKEFLAKLQQDILNINTTQRYGLDSREKAIVQNAQKEQDIRRKLSAELLAEEKSFQASSTSSQTAYLSSRVALENQAAKEIKDIQARNVRANKFDDKAGTYSSGFTTDVKNLSDSYKQQAAIAKEGANSLQALQRKVAEERVRIETKLAADVKAVEDKTFIDLMSGAKNTASGQLTILRKYYSDALKEVEKGEQAILAKVVAEAKKTEQAKKASLIGNFQQQLQTESNQKLALLEAGYVREKAVRDKGATSIQAQQAAIAEKRIKLEQDTAKELERIQSLTGKKASLGGLSLAEAGKQSKATIDLHHANADALNKEAAALEKTQSAHMNLTSFIGTSMIIWRSYNFVLGQTTSLLQAIPKVGMELDSTVSVLKATMGGSAGAAAGLKALDEEAGRTGINIIALRENWRTFSASTVVAGETMDTSWKIFSQMNTVITALHYNGDKATHIFMALSQIFNKSKVQSEELVKQLGNLLPAAFAVFAKAQGMSTMQLAQNMKKGLVFAHDTVAKFTAEYEKMFAISFANASKSLNAEVGRMQNEFIKLGEAIYKVTEKDMVAFVKKTGEVVSAIKPEQINFVVDGLKNLGEITAYVFGAKMLAKITLWTASLVGGATAVETATKHLSVIFKGLIIPAIFLEGFNLFADKVDEKNQKNIENTTKQIIEFSKATKELPKEISIKVLVADDENVIKITDLIHKLNTEIGSLFDHAKQPASDRFFSSIITGMEKVVQDFNNAGGLWGMLTQSNTESMQKIAGKKNTFKTEGFFNPFTDNTLRVPKLDEKTGTIVGYFWGTPADNAEAIKKDLAILEKARGLKLKAEEEAKRKSEALNVKSYVESETIKDKFDKLDLEKIKDKQEKAIATEALAHKENLALLTSEKDKVAQTVVAATAAVALAEKDYAEASSKVGKEAAAKTLKEQRETLILRKADLEIYQQRELSVEQAHQNKLDDIKQQYAKKDDELAKKQIELAKKTAEDLKAIQETATKDKIREIEKQITALEETKPDLAISSFYDQQIKYLEQEIALKKESLKVTQDTNAELIKTISVNQTPKDVNSLITAIRGGEARNGAKSYDLYPTGIKGKGGKPASTAKGDMQVLDLTYQEMLTKHPEVKEASLESAGKARVLAGEYLLKDLLAYYKDADIAAAAYFSGTGMGTETKVPVNAAFSKAGVKIGTENPAELAKVVSILKSDTSNRNGQSIAGYLKNFDKNYGNLDNSSLSAETTALKDNSTTLEDIAQIEERISKLKVSQKKEYKDVFKQIASIHAEYLLYTGKIEEGVEEKFAIKHKDLLKAINLELETTNKTEEEHNTLLKARNEIEALSIIQAKELASARAMKSLGKEEKSIEKQIATISQMESLNLLDPISAMLQRSDKKSNSLIPNLQNQLTELQGRDQSIMPEEKKAATIASIEEIQSKLLELSATANESFTFTANMISGAFDTTFRGILDGTIKGKDAFKEFGKSILKTMQDLVLQAIKSQIVGLILKGLGGIAGSFGSTSTFENAGTPYQLSSKLPTMSANGNVFNTGTVVPFNKGGIPDIGNNFQTFQMANGAAGSLREQGKYEAIMPLKRTANGELGIIAGNQVASNDQRQYNINVNVAGGADATNASDIGHQIAIATMEKIADTRIANASRIGNSQNRTTAFGGR